MVMPTPSSEPKGSGTPLSLTLEVFSPKGRACQFPVMVRSLSAKGVILATYLAPDDLDLEAAVGREAVIYLPGGEVSQIRSTVLWARPRSPDEPELVLGLELSESNLKVRRALEEQLLACPQDLKNLWDHWDAIQEEAGYAYPGAGRDKEAPRSFWPTAVKDRSAGSSAAPEAQGPPLDTAIYWVGAGAVVAGAGIYYGAPETYRLFGVILAIYGSLTIAGKSLWSMFSGRGPSS